MRQRTVSWFLGAIVLAILIGWTVRDSGPSVESTELTTVKIGGIRPLSRWNEIYFGGQPSREDLQKLRNQGFHTIINLRKSDEIDWNESEVVEELGMDYVHLPFGSPSELTDELFGKALQSLAAAGEEKCLLHCASSNRVGAIWYAYRRLEGGLSADEAYQEAQMVGLRSSNLLEAAKAYVEKQKPESPH